MDTLDINILSNRILLASPTIKTYSWGYLGCSFVKQFSRKSDIYSSITKDTPLAEAWISAHKNGDAIINYRNDRIKLSELIKNFPKKMLGENETELKILAKCLSCKEALSIQNHPSKEKSLLLNKLYPNRFDKNQKPEASIALTNLELLYGFLEIEIIFKNIKSINSFNSLFSEEEIDKLKIFLHKKETKEFLKFLLITIFSKPNEIIKKSSLKLYKDLEEKKELSKEEVFILDLKPKYPAGDIGLFFFFILKLITLKPGECFFISPGTLHAYLKGELFEFMYNSDNTLRAGLTEKQKDPELLIKITNFNPTQNPLITPEILNSKTKKYTFPKEAGFSIFKLSKGTHHITPTSIEFLITKEATGEIKEGLPKEIPPYSMWIVPASIPSYTLTLKKGTIYRMPQTP